MAWKLVAALLPVALALNISATLDSATAHHVYAGHGALSAGASSRLLWDYPEPQRSEILDYLFLPQFGAGLHMLKVEIGGDAQSTDGTEPSHMHTRNDLSCGRGYELFLIREAKKRNAGILTYGLSWGTPEWVGNGTYYSMDNVRYQTAFVDCIFKESGVAIDYLGLWNEKPQSGSDYVLALRASLDAAGFPGTKLIVMDGGFDNNEVQLANTNASYREAIHGAGLHYPCDAPHPEVERVGWDFWASEDYSRDPAWENGGTYWGKALSQNYIASNMTSTISWSLIWSAYTNLVCNGAGLMRAHTPWSGNYEASAPIWMSAHWTQFVSPGWRFLLPSAGGGSGYLQAPTGRPAGTYVTLLPPATSPLPPGTLAIIAETLVNDACIPRDYAPVTLTLLLQGQGMPGAGAVLQAWRTTRDAQFVRLADVVVGPGGVLTVSLPIDSITTFSNVPGAQHGTHAGSAIPPPAPWPLPYSEDFSGYAEDAMARFFSDQGGSWAVRGGALTMVAERDPGANAWAPNPDPLTQIGDESWGDYFVEAVVEFNTTGPYSSSPAEAARAAPRAGRRSAVVGERERVWRASQGLPVAAPAPLTGSDAGGSGVALLPCDDTDPSQAFLATASPGYLQNARAQTCLEVNGCGTLVDLYECVSGAPGSSCGAPAGSYPNLMWAFDAATGHLASGMSGAPVLSAFNGSLSALAVGAAGAQQAWDYNASSGALRLRSGGGGGAQCLSASPTQRYAKVCIRVASFNGFTAAPIDATCLRVLARGAWEVVGPTGATLATGALPAPFYPSQPHTLRLGASGPYMEAWVDGVSVLQLGNVSASVGNAAIGTGWHGSRWLNFTVGAM